MILGVDRNKLSKELKALGLTSPNINRKFDKEDLLKMKYMYSVEQKALHEIAKEFGVERRLVSKKLKEIGVVIRSNNPKNFPEEVYNDWAEQYKLGFSYQNIASKYHVSKETVRVYLQKKMNLPSRTSKKNFSPGTYLLWGDLYNNSKSLEDIGEEFEVSSSTVAKHLALQGIDRRTGYTFDDNVYENWIYMYNEDFTTREIASIHGVSKFSVSFHLDRKGIRMRKNWQWNLAKPHLLEAELSNDQKQLIIGSAMGDGTLFNQAKGAYLRMKHKEGQRAYLEYKMKILGEFVAEAGLVDTKTSANGKVFNQVYVCSVPNMFIKQIWTLTYQSGERIIKDIIPSLDSLGLAILWCDDGSINRKGSGHLSTCNFSWEDNELLAAHLQEKFKIECYVNKKYDKYYDKNYPYIYVTVEGMKGMIRVIQKYVPPSMRYKLGEYSH